jgi:DNA replication protein DnaC
VTDSIANYFRDIVYPQASQACSCGAPCDLPGQCTACAEKVRAERHLRRALQATVESIPLEYRWANFDAPELVSRVAIPEAVRVARIATDAGPPFIFVYGPSGSGKTSLAACILRRRAEASQTAGCFFAAHRLGVARAHTRLGSGDAPLIHEAMSVRLAVLDDLGSERDYGDNAIADVIFERHAAQLGTVVTTGFSKADIVARYGAGIARRLTERAALVKLGSSGGCPA